MTVGGVSPDLTYTNVELVSLEPATHPIPYCLRRLRHFPGGRELDAPVGGPIGSSTCVLKDFTKV